LTYVTLALVTSLVARAVCASSGSPAPLQQGVADPSPLLHFGQSLAIADFDGDNRPDKATLAGTGRNKSIEIRLSKTASVIIHFDTRTGDRGSLFVQDVDQDGDNDLIWTDLVHPGDVIVWLDDGAGKFERASADKYANEFVLTDAPAFGVPEAPHQDYAFSPWQDPSSSLSPPHVIRQTSESSTSTPELDTPLRACFLRAIFDRGPPSLP